MNIAPHLIASALLGVMAQRLVRTLCPRCKGPIPAEAEMIRKLRIADPAPVANLFRGRGCPNCEMTGFYGRTVLGELMRVDEQIRKIIVSKGTASTIRLVAKSKGMKTLWEVGVAKVLQGLTGVDEVVRTCVHEDDL